MRVLILLLIPFLIFSCKGDLQKDASKSGVTTDNQDGETAQISVQKQEVKNINLPRISDLVSSGFVAKTFGVSEDAIEVKDVVPSAESKACFYKWDDPEIPNAGILLRIMKNPVPVDFPSWPTEFINSKITRGESGADGKSVMYQKFEGIGEDGAYNLDVGKFFWRTADNLIFVIAYNSSIPDKKKMKLAKVMGKEMMKNFKL